jgi:hypothetical protein
MSNAKGMAGHESRIREIRAIRGFPLCFEDTEATEDSDRIRKTIVEAFCTSCSFCLKRLRDLRVLCGEKSVSTTDGTDEQGKMSKDEGMPKREHPIGAIRVIRGSHISVSFVSFVVKNE